jgi:aquaporin Z
MKTLRSYIAEFIGTFFFVLTVCVAAVLGYAGPYAPIAIGSVLMVMVFANGHISGAHLNPAVSLAILVRGKLPGRDFIPYAIAQLLAAVAAATVAYTFKKSGTPIDPIATAQFPQWLAEFLFTFALCYVVLNVATAKGNAGNSFYGLAIGFTVLVGAFTLGPVSGGAFNPAIATGLLITGKLPFFNWITYFIVELFAAACAGLVFNALNPEDR